MKVTRLQRGYLPVLHTALRHPVITLALAFLIFVGTVGAATLLKTDFLGSFADEHTLQVAQKLPAGTRLETTSKAAAKVEKVLADTPSVKGYLTQIGGGGIPGVQADTGANTASFTVTLVDGVDAKDEKAPLQQSLDQLTGAGELTVTTTDSGGTSNDVSVVVSADNTDALREGADITSQLLATVPGLSNVRSDLADQRKLLKIDVDLREAAKKGFTQAEVGQAVSNAVTGTQIGTVTLEGESRDILLRTESTNATPADIAGLELPVSQLQQQDATEKATDKLKDKQQAASDRAQADADKAAADQRDELRKQRDKAADALVDTRAALRKLKANPPKAPKLPAGVALPAFPAAGAGAGGPVPAPVPSCEPADPTNPKDPCLVSGQPPAGLPLEAQVKLAQEQAAAATKLAVAAATQASVAQAQVAGLQAQAAAAAYGQQLQQYAQQVGQLTATVDQTDKTVSQLDDQLEAAAEQSDKAADQRAEQEDLADEQEGIADVRAKPIRVRDVADVKEVLAPTTVTQINATPSVTVTATPTGSDLGATTKLIQQRLDDADNLPAGVTAKLGGSAQDQSDAFRQLGLAMLVAIALVFVIMVATFRSLVQPLILLVSIPFAATGALVGLLVTGTPLGVPSMIGLLMLIGIVVTNAIVLIDLINQYRRRGEDVMTAVVDGARLRLRPIIMTASATICALIPMGLGLTGGGAFISQPLAVVVIGGLVSSTLLTLLLVPVLYLLLERTNERRHERRTRRRAARAATA